MYVCLMTNTSNTNNTGHSAADAEIADRIQAAMKDSRMSALALSEQAGIAYPTLRRSLKGGRSLTFRELHQIADAIRIQPSALMPASLKAAA